MIFDLIFLLATALMLYPGWQVARRVSPWVDHSFRNAQPAPWYVPPAPGSRRDHVERTLVWALPLGITLMCVFLVWMFILAIRIKFLQLAIVYASDISAFLEIVTRFLQ